MKAAETSEIETGRMRAVRVDGKEILVVNVDGRYFAIGCKCTHAGGDLSKGSLSGNIVTCPRHGAKFDVMTGESVSGPKIGTMKLKTGDEQSFEVRVEGKEILVKAG